MNDSQEQFRVDVSELSASVKLLAERIENLIALNRDVIRWLLIVVCVIALGRGLLDISQAMLKSQDAKAIVMEGK